MAGLDGNLITFITFCIFAMNWISMDLLREFSMKMYFKVPPGGPGHDTTKYEVL
jgi:hypothetical protein